jgi:allantoinase
MQNSEDRNTIFDVTIVGNIVMPDRILSNCLIGIHNGRIAGIFENDSAELYRDRIDAHGKYILPGAVDAHVHSYSSPQEGFLNATRSAAAGGVTTIIDMPYDAGAPVVSSKEFIAKRSLIEKEAVVDVALLGTIKKEGGLNQIPVLAESGVCGFKVSLFETDPKRFPRIPDGELVEAFRLVEETGLPIGVHAENDDIVKRGVAHERSFSISDPLAHSRSRPKVAESEAVLRALEFAYWTGVRLHIYHASYPRIFELVSEYRKQGVRVSAETCPHYLLLTDEDLLRIGAKAKVNPPLRSGKDKNGLWHMCREGQIDMITSDHVPWPIESKQQANIFDNSAGMPGVEMLLPIIFSEGVSKNKITINDLVRLLSENPAKTFGLFPRKGQICVGADADLVILDPEPRLKIDEKTMHSSAGWSPYNGYKIRGSVNRTIVRGKTVYDGSRIIERAGFGKFVDPRKANSG